MGEDLGTPKVSEAECSESRGKGIAGSLLRPPSRLHQHPAGPETSRYRAPPLRVLVTLKIRTIWESQKGGGHQDCILSCLQASFGGTLPAESPLGPLPSPLVWILTCGRRETKLLINNVGEEVRGEVRSAE